MKWNHNKVIYFKRNNTKPKLLFTFFEYGKTTACFLIGVLNEATIEWFHCKHKLKNLLCFDLDLFIQMLDQQIYSNIKKRCCVVFCAPECQFFKPSDTCLDFITLCCVCDNFWSDLRSVHLFKIFGLVLKLALLIKTMLWLLFWMQPL